MNTAVETPERVLLRPDDDTSIAQPYDSRLTPSHRRGFNQLPEPQRWEWPEALEQAYLTRMFRLFLRQPNPTSPLPRFRGSQRSDNVREYGPQSHQRSILETNSGPLVQDSASQATTNANISHRRTPGPTLKLRPLRNSREERHRQRKQELLALLQPSAQEHDSECSHLFLCWGEKSRCKILAVKIPNSADDVTIWQLIRQAWYTELGKWRKYIPVSDVQQIEIVKV